MQNLMKVLRACGIQPTPQRMAVAEFILTTKSHPTADLVLERVKAKCPTISRATVYNTLNLMVEKGILQSQILREGTVAFDPNVAKHHHFIDDETGDIYDIPWDSLKVTGEKTLKDFHVRELNVVLRGKKKR